MDAGFDWLNPSTPSEVFVLCASLRGDDANQWRNYGGTEVGYSIELDSSASFQVASNAGALEPTDKGIGYLFDQAEVSPWSLVAYSDEHINKMLDSLLKWARHVIDWARAAPAPDPESGDPLPGQEADYEMAVAIGTAAKLIKSEGFSGEQEARTFTHWVSRRATAATEQADTGSCASSNLPDVPARQPVS
jgi:hypothetical protein